MTHGDEGSIPGSIGRSRCADGLLALGCRFSGPCSPAEKHRGDVVAAELDKPRKKLSGHRRDDYRSPPNALSRIRLTTRSIKYASTSCSSRRSPSAIRTRSSTIATTSPRVKRTDPSDSGGNERKKDQPAVRSRATSSALNARTAPGNSTDERRPSRTAMMKSWGPRPDSRSASAGDKRPSGTISLRVIARRRARTTLGCPMSPTSSLIARDESPARWASTMAESLITRIT